MYRCLRLNCHLNKIPRWLDSCVFSVHNSSSIFIGLLYRLTRACSNCVEIAVKMKQNHCAQSLRWRHNQRDSVSNHQPHDCLPNRLFRRGSKKTSKFRVTGLCVGNSPGTGEFLAQMASHAENVSIWRRHHVFCNLWWWICRSFQCHLAWHMWTCIYHMFCPSHMLHSCRCIVYTK